MWTLIAVVVSFVVGVVFADNVKNKVEEVEKDVQDHLKL